MSQLERSNFVGLGSNRGLSLIEVMIALALLGVVTVAAYALGRSTLTSTSRVSRNIVDALNTDISVRGLNYEISNSEIMRKFFSADGKQGGALATCSNQTLMGPDVLTKQQSFEKIGDGFSFIYASRRMVGATSVDQSTAIVVPDTQPFYKGAVLLLTSLDGDKLQSFYSVDSIDESNLTLVLTSNLPTTPAQIGCALNTAGSNTAILNQLNVRKFAVDILAFSRYQVEADPSAQNRKRLVAKLWPLRNFMSNKDSSNGNDIHSSPVIDNFQKMSLSELFTPTMTGSQKGEYTATFKVDYSQPLLSLSQAAADKVLDFKSGYRMTGVEISNPAAIPDPPSIEKTYVTCSVVTTPVQNTYVRQSNPKEFATIFRIEAIYSEADTLSGGNTPSISAVLTQNSPGGDPIQCWRPADIQGLTLSGQVGPMMTGLGVGSSFGFEKADATVTGGNVNALVNPVYCYIPSDSQINATLRYVQVTPDGYTPQLVTCSSSDVKGAPTDWKYDDKGPSKCSLDGGIFIGQLVGLQDESIIGPQLVTSSCTWSGSTLTTCNPFVVLSDNPDAQLVKVKFNPAGIKINSVDGSEITCE